MDDPIAQYIVDEVRENRREIVAMRNEVSGKVGRGELFGWLGSVSTLIGLILIFVA